MPLTSAAGTQVAGQVCSPDITGTNSERLWTASLALSYKQLQPLGGANSLQETVTLHVFRIGNADTVTGGGIFS